MYYIVTGVLLLIALGFGLYTTLRADKKIDSVDTTY